MLDIAAYFEKVSDFIMSAAAEMECKNKNKSESASANVLVHCLAGKSRSSAVIAAFLLHTNVVDDLQEAMEFIRSNRPNAQPNLGFCAQLRAFARRVKTKDTKTETRVDS
mmetsp:Transcript_16959/g.20941  ORF Transcript_16959/g.20941 Transcript_16959/m.20941 type:complete len:110 (+) Transcript_16959:185-514(+)